MKKLLLGIAIFTSAITFSQTVPDSLNISPKDQQNSA